MYVNDVIHRRVIPNKVCDITIRYMKVTRAMHVVHTLYLTGIILYLTRNICSLSLTK